MSFLQELEELENLAIVENLNKISETYKSLARADRDPHEYEKIKNLMIKTPSKLHRLKKNRSLNFQNLYHYV